MGKRPNLNELIAFRVTPELAKRIDALKDKQQSRSVWARQALQERVYGTASSEHDAKLDAVLERLELLSVEQRRLMEMLPKLALVLLVKVADLEVAEARKLIRKVFGQHEEDR